MKCSIIIPTLNEAENIGRLVAYLQQNADHRLVDLIVVDGGSRDGTTAVAQGAGALVVDAPRPGRASQMNLGSTRARGDLLYFVHADTLPPATYLDDLEQAVADGYPMGCFRFRFDSSRPLLRINAFFTRFEPLWCRGGDQTLFVTRSFFEELDGYREDHWIMEEYDLIRRARKKAPFRIIPRDVVASARKYENNGYFRVQLANLVVFNMFRWGASQEKMVRTYKRMLNP